MSRTCRAPDCSGRRRVVGALWALVVLTGCALGPRPTLGQSPKAVPTGSTGNETLDAMLGRLAASSTQSFTAAYAITRQVGPVTTSATVVQHPPQIAVVMGAVTFYKGPSERTCTTGSNACTSGIVEQKVSDTGVTSTFYSTQVATQIRVNAKRRSGDLSFETQTVANTASDCVKIPIGNGVELYCVTKGPITVVSRVQRADYTIEMSSLSNVVTDSVFPTP
jgi:hypothetical protein